MVAKRGAGWKGSDMSRLDAGMRRSATPANPACNNYCARNVTNRTAPPTLMYESKGGTNGSLGNYSEQGQTWSRAVLANMTTQSRISTFFQERTVAEDATFFDLLKMLGFRMITITDGEKLTHQVTIK